MKRILDTKIYADIPMKIDLLFPGIFCTLALLLCGLYPLALSRAPVPRAAEVPHAAPDLRDASGEPLPDEASPGEEIACALLISTGASPISN
jgi:hypothetical protein